MLARHRLPLLYGVLILFAGALLFGAYHGFQQRYLRPFSDRPVLFSGNQLSLPAVLAGRGHIRLVHFWDPGCPCNVGNQAHLAALIERFAAQGVDFFVVQKPGSQGRLPANLATLRPLPELAALRGLPASPAVAIWDRDGRLAYFGPYSEGTVCSSANSFIEPVLQALLDGRRVEATHNLATGCYCPWTDADQGGA